jgi:hypothetical protein
MSTFFEGPEPSDGLRMKKVSSISSTACDMMIGGKPVKRRATPAEMLIRSKSENSTPELLFE